MKKGEVENSEFTLPNKTILVKFIPRANPMVNSNVLNHIAEGGMLEGAVCRYSAPLQKNGTVKNVLTTVEKEALEAITGFNLSVYGDFWKTFRVALYKNKLGNPFDLSNPVDYISYKLLQSYSTTEIAPSWSDKDKYISYKFAITEEDELVTNKKKSFNIKRDAYKAYAKIESDDEKVLGILKLLVNAPISKNTSPKVLRDKLEDIIDNEPQKFLSVVNDNGLDTKMLLLKGVEKGYIVKTGNRYTTKDGLELCEAGEIPLFANAVKYLDANKNQDVRSLIEAKINK